VQVTVEVIVEASLRAVHHLLASHTWGRCCRLGIDFLPKRWAPGIARCTCLPMTLLPMQRFACVGAVPDGFTS